ncbi:hypothetical protein F441_10125 [Phytophthora nicotianae CJ01A1]|uniref:Uncharacterized protein n=3 Tax=Phytophthora nicotianae TaxID=4792 RepID=V9F374_PHYNI|nr:hypothetical protein F443_10184 [Phytophthora nicotianae P1569]ETO73799.1 hypothetical protein F444_10280 [Phytophthora nicotianae P1976]ETP15017.1 hypothetical protein F441_10125 [Phytophthora nicotianae CJ01A1]
MGDATNSQVDNRDDNEEWLRWPTQISAATYLYRSHCHGVIFTPLRQSTILFINTDCPLKI